MFIIMNAYPMVIDGVIHCSWKKLTHIKTENKNRNGHYNINYNSSHNAQTCPFSVSKINLNTNHIFFVLNETPVLS